MNALSSAEKTWALSLRELRLLGRSRSRLLGALIVPVFGGAVAGLAERATSIPTTTPSLFVLLPLCAILFAADSRVSGTRAAAALSAVTNRSITLASWVVAALLLLAVQAVILIASAAILGGLNVEPSIIIGAVGVSLAAGSAVRRLLGPG